jgi:hypothetical protein
VGLPERSKLQILQSIIRVMSDGVIAADVQPFWSNGCTAELPAIQLRRQNGK